jgi:hypothetical protein
MRFDIHRRQMRGVEAAPERVLLNAVDQQEV